MSYTPTSWQYNVNEKNEKIYVDHILNIIQENLLTISKFIDDFRDDARYSITIVQDNVNSKTVHDPTVSIIGMFVSKIIEGLGVVFTAGTGAAIIATITCKIISAIVSTVTSDKSTDTYNKILQASNDLRDALEQVCFGIQLQIGRWLDDMRSNWLVEFECDGKKYPEFKGKVKLADFAETQEYFPKPASADYILIREKLSRDSKYESTSLLLPVRWKIRTHRAFPADGVSNYLCGWQVEFYKVRNRSTWDQWHSSSQFPNIPSNLSGDIEGPLEYIELGDNSHAQRFMSWYEAFRDYSWSDGSKFEESKKYNGTRWMGFSGRNDYNIDKDDHENLTKGTSFLDLIDDILNGVYNAYGDWSVKNSLPNEPSYYLWYKTKRPNEGVEIINDRRVYTLMSNDSCQDWVYDSYDIFHWGRAYKGIKLNHYTLIDQDGNYAPSVLCKWLFSDNGHGDILNENGVATREDVYHKWGLSFE
jgi:hypothetical protein